MSLQPQQQQPSSMSPSREHLLSSTPGSSPASVIVDVDGPYIGRNDRSVSEPSATQQLPCLMTNVRGEGPLAINGGKDQV